jgi:hypothetical protein
MVDVTPQVRDRQMRGEKSTECFIKEEDHREIELKLNTPAVNAIINFIHYKV